MGWFGSLGLAYKYALVLGVLLFVTLVLGVSKIIYNRRRLKKFTRKMELEAQSVHEERVELNARQLDEGDLFGIRAIQSGYFGGVAQSRPASLAEPHSPDSLTSITGPANQSSSKLIGTPMSSVTTLPVDANLLVPSSLAHDGTAGRENGRSITPPRRKPMQINSRLRPSEAELNGRINHDPAVNMSLEIPPSPVGGRGTSSPGSSIESRSPSPSHGFPAAQRPYGATPPSLRPGMPLETRDSAQRIAAPQAHVHEVKSQSGSIISRSTSARSRPDELRSPHHSIYQPPYQAYAELPARPAQAVRADRPMSSESYYPPRSSSVPSGAPQHLMRQSWDDDVPLPKPPRTESAVSDWGPGIFEEINESLEDSRSISGRDHSPDHGPHARPPLTSSSNLSHSETRGPWISHPYTDHTSKFSDSSSVYSSANLAQRHSSKKISIDPKSMSRPTGTLPSSAPSDMDRRNQQSPASSQGTRRASDASSHHPVSGSESTGDGSHRNTRELGDFYDSYWRQSIQGVPSAGRAAEAGKQSHSGFSASRDGGRDGRRPGAMDLKVTTIREVPSPLASPMPGTAL